MDKLSRIIEFSSANFPFVKEDEDLCNHDTMHGYALAKHIADGLQKRGIKVADYIAEDWGWLCEVQHTGDYPITFGVASYDRSEEFIIQFEPRKSEIRKWFRKIDVSGPLSRLQDAVFNTLDETEENTKGPEWFQA